MTEIAPIVDAELEVFRQSLPKEDRDETCFDGIPWDVVKARFIAYRDNRSTEMIDATVHWKNIRISSEANMNKAHARSEQVDLNKPVILIKWKNDVGVIEDRIIDGRHRLFKAVHKGIAVLPAYILSAEEGQLCILPNMPSGI